jgi:peptidoglycan/LPS O-acetylase OafA/YrhL
MAATVEIPRPSYSDRFLAPYRRITSSGQLIPEIDGLRFVAIFAVYIYHLAGDVLRHSPAAQVHALSGQWFFSVTQILNVGVPIFFAISGFILGMPFAVAHRRGKKPVGLKKYYLRRVTRLEPPYIVCLLLFFGLKVLAGRGTAGELLPNLFASIFYVHNLVYGAPSVISIVAWSLEIEVQFYILAPLLALVFAVSSNWLRRSLLAALLLSTTALSSLVASNPTAQHSLLAYAQYFLAGFALVEIQLSGGLRRQASWLWDLVSLGGWALFLALLVRGGALANWAAPWLILLLVVAAFRGLAVNRFVTNPWIATIGGMCYSLYLLHDYILSAAGIRTESILASHSFEVRLLLQFVLITPLVLGLSAIYFRFLERPCMQPDWPQRLRSKIGHWKMHGFAASEVAVPRTLSDK